MDQRLQREIAHGKFLAQHDAGEIWNWETPTGKLRWKRRANMLLSHITPEMNVLEIGCGTGYFTQEIAKTRAHIVAIDISPDLLKDSRNNIPYANVHFSLGNAYQLGFQDQVFESVIGISVLHHLEIDKALYELHRVLKLGGLFCFTEPNMLNPQIAVQKNIPYIKKKLGDSPDETAFFKWELYKKLQKYGFREIQVIPFDFLHPQIPEKMIPFFKPVCEILERLPIISEFAGSLYIQAQK
jgi:ubiquinone/menaquinone biosynthesis C-methylase UbiE